jgi:protein-S-isoprenylcysteine O-methyltransferase Ste14
MGQLIRIAAVGFSLSGTSGRENYLRADQLNTTGLYSLVRNPLYLGNILIYLGLLLVFSNPWALLVLVIFLFFQYTFIILAEEHYLSNKYGSEYAEYSKRVSRLIPSFKNFSRVDSKFDWQKVLFKENDSVFNQLVMFMLILAFKEYTFYDRITNGLGYVLFSAILIGLYIYIKILKKRYERNIPFSP